MRSRRRGSGRRSAACEAQTVDRVTAVGGQGDPVAGLGRLRARLGVLVGQPADLDHGYGRAVGQHHGHLEQGPQLAVDRVGGDTGERLGTVTALEHEGLATGHRGHPLPQPVALLGEDEFGQPGELGRDLAQQFRIGPGGLLGGRPGIPGIGAAGFRHQGEMHRGLSRREGCRGPGTRGAGSAQRIPTVRAECGQGPAEWSARRFSNWSGRRRLPGVFLADVAPRPECDPEPGGQRASPDRTEKECRCHQRREAMPVRRRGRARRCACVSPNRSCRGTIRSSSTPACSGNSGSRRSSSSRAWRVPSGTAARRWSATDGSPKCACSCGHIEVSGAAGAVRRPAGGGRRGGDDRGPGRPGGLMRRTAGSWIPRRSGT